MTAHARKGGENRSPYKHRNLKCNYKRVGGERSSLCIKTSIGQEVIESNCTLLCKDGEMFIDDDDVETEI